MVMPFANYKFDIYDNIDKVLQIHFFILLRWRYIIIAHKVHHILNYFLSLMQTNLVFILRYLIECYNSTSIFY